MCAGWGFREVGALSLFRPLTRVVTIHSIWVGKTKKRGSKLFFSSLSLCVRACVTDQQRNKGIVGLDWPASWPSFFPSLSCGLLRIAGARQHRGTYDDAHSRCNSDRVIEKDLVVPPPLLRMNGVKV